jgi:hypothetical protein
MSAVAANWIYAEYKWKAMSQTIVCETNAFFAIKLLFDLYYSANR